MSELTLAELSDALSDDRDAIRTIDEKLKTLKSAYREKEQKILERMKEEGALRVTGQKATISVSVNTVANVKDWDKFYRYIKKNDAFHLLERRPASKAWREEVENRRGKVVPGTEGFEKRTLNLRNT
jgi:hypothetical protein